MVDKHHISQLRTALSVVGLALLLVLSPCKLRHFIQGEIGLPQTEVSNKNKAVLTDADCEVTDAAVYANGPSDKTPPETLPAENLTPQPFPSEGERKSLPTVTRGESAAGVPYYILYRRFQVYA